MTETPLKKWMFLAIKIQITGVITTREELDRAISKVHDCVKELETVQGKMQEIWMRETEGS